MLIRAIPPFAILSAALLGTNPRVLGADADAEALATKKVELKKGDRIIFFGDSLTELAGKEAPPKYVSKGYVRIVREKLQESHKDLGLEVDWVARADIPSQTSSSVSTRMSSPKSQPS